MDILCMSRACDAIPNNRLADIAYYISYYIYIYYYIGVPLYTRIGAESYCAHRGGYYYIIIIIRFRPRSDARVWWFFSRFHHKRDVLTAFSARDEGTDGSTYTYPHRSCGLTSTARPSQVATAHAHICIIIIIIINISPVIGS